MNYPEVGRGGRLISLISILTVTSKGALGQYQPLFNMSNEYHNLVEGGYNAPYNITDWSEESQEVFIACIKIIPVLKYLVERVDNTMYEDDVNGLILTVASICKYYRLLMK